MIIVLSAFILALCATIYILYNLIEQEKKNRIALSKKIESNLLHLKKDIQIWTGQADQGRKEFKKFEDVYIHHMSEVNARLKNLEELTKKDGGDNLEHD